MNKAVQKKFFEKLLSEGKALEFVNDVSRADLEREATVKQLYLSPDDYKVENLTLVSVPHLLTEIVKQFKAEQLMRIEALRIMYAGSLLENANLQKSANITDAQRARILVEMIQTINPDVTPVQLYSAVQDTLWRSPTAMWPVLIDSCRVRGVFSSALKLPSVQSAIEVVGGYC